jgi:hypothetical protein
LLVDPAAAATWAGWSLCVEKFQEIALSWTIKSWTPRPLAHPMPTRKDTAHRFGRDGFINSIIELI